MNGTLVVFASKQEFNTIFPQISAVVASTTPQSIDNRFDVAVCGVGMLDFSANKIQSALAAVCFYICP